MRYHEIVSGFRLHLSRDEQAVLDRVNKDGRVWRDDLDEYDQEVAARMVTRGVLRRKREDGKVYYWADSMKDLWRI